MPHPAPSSLQPRAPSPTSPVEFPMNVKQAYKAFAAVPRSLAVLEPPQVGCDAWTASGSQPETHAVMIGWSHPAPSSLELAAPCRRGLVMCCDVWNALIFLLFFFFFFCTCPQVPSWPFGVDSFFHPWWTLWTNFHLPYALLLYPAWSVTLCLFYIWLCPFLDVLHRLQDLYGVRNNFHHRQSTPEVSPRISRDHEFHFRDVIRLMTNDYIGGFKHCCAFIVISKVFLLFLTCFAKVRQASTKTKKERTECQAKDQTFTQELTLS